MIFKETETLAEAERCCSRMLRAGYRIAPDPEHGIKPGEYVLSRKSDDSCWLVAINLTERDAMLAGLW